MGKHPNTLLSQQRCDMQPYGVVKVQSIGSTAQTQATNFRIGTGYKPGMQFQTTYGTVTGQGARYGTKAGLDDITAKKTSILLGHGNRNGFVTTNQRVYSSMDSGKIIKQVNKDFAHNIKSSHFNFGNSKTLTQMQKDDHYNSLSKVSYNFKGDAVKLRS